MSEAEKKLLREMHRPHWNTTWVWLGLTVTFFSLQALLAWLVYTESFWLTVPLVLLLAHLMHGHLIAFHEAAHESLSPARWCNDLFGEFVALFGFMSLSLYRAAHHYHHAYLATERDEELWPFVIPGTPRWLRCLAATAELTLGLFYTPALFLRTFLRPGSPITNPKVRRRVWAELVLLATLWTVAITLVAWWGLWTYFAIVYLVPALLAGNLQSWRKYIEHMGLTGSTVLGSTRSVIPRSIVGHVFAFSLFNEPYHGVHHKFGQLPQTALPTFASMLAPSSTREPSPYPSYREALVQMVATLHDPRVGAQWLGSPGFADRR